MGGGGVMKKWVIISQSKPKAEQGPIKLNGFVSNPQKSRDFYTAVLEL